MRRLCAAIGVAVGVIGSVAADTASPDPVTALVKQLGDTRFQVRETAARELLKHGPAAVPALEAALTTATSAELRERAEAVREQITRQTDSARLVATKMVSIDYKAMPLTAALADLKTKTGINLTVSPGKVADPTRLVTCKSAGDVSAWEAVDLLLKAAGLVEEFRTEAANQQTSTSYYSSRTIYYGNNRPTPSPGTMPVYVADGVGASPSGSRETGVRVLVMPGRFPGNKVVRGAGRLVLTLDVAPLPSINFGEVTSVRVTRAEDEDGRPLLPDLKPVTETTTYNPYWGGRFFGGGGIWWDEDNSANPGGVANPRLVPVALRTNDKAFRSLKKLEGVVVGEVNLQNQPLMTIEKLAESVGKQPAAGPDEMKMSVLSYTPDKDGKTQVKVRIELLQQWVIQQRKQAARNGGMNINFWGGGWDGGAFNNMQQVLLFTDKDGKPVPLGNQRGMSSTSDGWRQSCEIDYLFPKSDKHGPPVKLVYRGTKPVTVEVPFRAANVAVP